MDLQRLKTDLDVSHVKKVGFRALSNFHIYENPKIIIEVKFGKVIFYFGDGHLMSDDNLLVFSPIISTRITSIDINGIDKDQLFNESLIQDLYGLDMDCIDIINEVLNIVKEAKLIK